MSRGRRPDDPNHFEVDVNLHGAPAPGGDATNEKLDRILDLLIEKDSGLPQRVQALEDQVSALTARVLALESSGAPRAVVEFTIGPVREQPK